MKNMLETMQKAMSMKKEMKRIQGELAQQKVEYSCKGGKITVIARADMTIDSIKIDPRSVDPAKVENLQELIVAGVNGALKSAQKKAGGAISKLTGGLGGLSDLLG